MSYDKLRRRMAKIDSGVSSTRLRGVIDDLFAKNPIRTCTHREEELAQDWVAFVMAAMNAREGTDDPSVLVSEFDDDDEEEVS